MLPEIAETVLARMAEGKPIKKVKIAVTKDSNFSYKIS
jgi:type VI secretion system protein VasG